jgi:hypothetical protein
VAEARAARDRIAFAAVALASAAAGWLVYHRLVLLRIPPFWDEAAHMLQGALIAHDVRAGDLPALLLDTYRQIYWPPLHSWVVGGVFLATGPDLEAARAVSVVAYALLAPVLWLVARTVDSRHGALAGTIAALLALSSPGIVVYGARSMLEVPGLLALSLTILAYCLLERRPDLPPRAHALLGVGIVATYLVKTNYGVLLALALVVTRLIAARFRVRALLTRRNLYAALPVAIFCAIWFAYPVKILSTWQALVNRPWGGEEATGLAGLMFYPRAIAYLAGSWWVAGVLWAGVFAAWRWRRIRGVPFLLVLTLMLFLLGEIHHTKLERHIMPMFPPMFVLTGIAAARAWATLGGRRFGRAAALLVVGLLSALQVAMLAQRGWTPRGYSSGMDVMEHVFTESRRHASVLVLGLEGVWPQPPVTDWHLVSAGMLDPSRAGTAMDPRQDRRLVDTLRDAPIPEPLAARLQDLMERYDAPASIRTLYQSDRMPEDRAQFAAVVAATIEADPPQTIVSLIGMAEAGDEDAIPPEPPVAGFREISVRDFPESGTRVHVYRRE